MKKSPLSLRSLPLLLALAAVTPLTARAGSATWNGSADAADWSNTANWTPATVPGIGETATFNETGAAATGVFAPTSVLNLAFSGAVAHNLSSIAIDNGGSVSSAADSALQTVGVVTLLGHGTVTSNSAAATPLTLAGVTMTNATPANQVVFNGDGVTTLSTLNSGGNIATKFAKNGNGTLIVTGSNSSNIPSALGLAGDAVTLNSGVIRITNKNALGISVLNLAGGTLEAAGSAASDSQWKLINITGNVTMLNSTASGDWRLGNASTGTMLSTGSPTVTFDCTNGVATNSSFRMDVKTSDFVGTWRLGGKCFVRLRNLNSGGAGITLDTGSVAGGVRALESGATFQDSATLSIKPAFFGALTGSAADGILRGRQSVGTQTTGTQYRIGALNSDTVFNGIIADGVATNGTATGAAPAKLQDGAGGSQGTTELVKEGNGSLTLSGTANTYTGGTVISGGTLVVAGDGSLGAAYDGSLRLFSLVPGTGAFSALPVATLTGGGGSGAQIRLASSTNGLTSNTFFLTFAGPGPALADGAGPTYDNTKTGSGYTSDPTVTITSAVGNPACSASVRVKGLLTFDGGILKMSAPLTSNRAILVKTSNGYIDTNGHDSTLSGPLTGPGAIQHQGAGLLTLTGTGSSAGINIAGGASTRLNGTTSGGIVVTEGGMLSGTGSTTGGVTVRASLGASGALSPGASVGALGTGLLILHPMAKYHFEISDWNGAAGTGYDTVNAASLDVSGSSTYPIAIHVNELALANFDGTSKSFTLVATTGGITGFAAENFVINSAGFTTGAGPWSVAVSGNNLVLNYTGSSSPYDTWASGFSLAGADALKSADPDKDGVTNLAEFAFNSNPKAGTAPGGPNGGGIEPVTGGDALTLTIRVRSGATFAGANALTATKDGVTYRIEGSSDLSTWTADIDEVTPALTAGLSAPDAGWEYRTFRFAAGVATTARAQIRAVASE